jgi:hypothetical protein
MLRLDKAKDNYRSPISCYLEEVDLDDPSLQYQALSYVWGDAQPTSSIFVNGKDFAVRANLRDALFQLRTDTLFCCDLACACYKAPGPPPPMGYVFTAPLLLWIDAICINQQDREERARQVMLMRDIYRQASRVVAWLGKASEHTVPAVRLLLGLSSLYDYDEETGRELISHLVLDDYFKGHWIALGNLFQRQWWSRAWIVQEACFATEELLVCGQYAVDWAHIQKSTTVLGPCVDHIDELIEATTNNPEIGAVFWPFNRGMSRLKVFRLLRFYLENKQHVGDGILTTLLIIFQNTLATEPRDKVYAMLGLAEELSKTSSASIISVDYKMSVCEVFTRTAEVLYNESGDVTFLDFVERSSLHGTKRCFDLLSWAPDWTLTSAKGQFLTDWDVSMKRMKARGLRCAYKPFPFTADKKAICLFDHVNKKVTVRGFRFDSVREIQKSYSDLAPSVKFDNITRYGWRLGWKLPSASDIHERHLYWTAFLGSQFLPKSPTEPKGPGIGCPNKDPCLLEFLCVGTKNHCFVGITDGAAAVTDVICGFLGGKFPYILRQRGGCWQYVGQ